tara:strand:- start:2926 stop:4161 length:1236 start_codon:yes stop_codon:yes gene_type:complete
MKKYFFVSSFLFFVILTVKISAVEIDNPKLLKKAQKLAQKYLIVDGHVDIPYRLNVGWEDISVKTDKGDFDYIRTVSGGLDAPFMSIYIPSSYQSEMGASKQFGLEMIGLIERLVKEHPNHFAFAYTPDDLIRNKELGLISLPMGMENGSGIENDITNLKLFFDKGIRYITLTHAKDNLISDSSYAITETWNGLSSFGKDVVKEMNRLGIMIDISHVSDNAAFQVLELSKAPVIASHSSMRYFTPGWHRNMSDEILIKLAENDGVIMINFGSDFLLRKSQLSKKVIEGMVRKWSLQLPKEERQKGDDHIKQLEKEYKTSIWRQYYRFADVEDVVDHIDYVVKLVGIDYVAFGSDFDGVGDSLPSRIKDASMYPNIIYLLLDRGYTTSDIKKICSDNVLRVWRKVIKIAEES